MNINISQIVCELFIIDECLLPAASEAQQKIKKGQRQIVVIVAHLYV